LLEPAEPQVGWTALEVSARFNRPVSISKSGSFLFIVDAENNTIRKISIITGEVTSTVIGNPGVDGPAAIARVWMPADVTTDGIICTLQTRVIKQYE